MPTILLKPCQNMKGQPFVVMLGFCMSFFEFASAACYKKRHAKTEHDNKFLVILILSELYWPLQIFRSSWPTTRVTKSFSVFYWFPFLYYYSWFNTSHSFKEYIALNSTKYSLLLCSQVKYASIIPDEKFNKAKKIQCLQQKLIRTN